MKLPRTKVLEEQFAWDGDRLIHRPTGAWFAWSYPDSDTDDVTINWSRCGDVLDNGDDYDRGDVGGMASQLLAEKRR
jgi:hypothetical protein